MHTLTLVPSVEPLSGHLRMGEAPDLEDRIYANSTHLVRADRPWFPVMGEFHFSRYPRQAWREQLLSLRAGGIGVVATYLFWHHHEEKRGVFRFDGNRDVRAFVELAAECGLDAVVRIGPWSHGEARFGGFPDWVQNSGNKTRTDDPAYLELVAPYYTRIATELAGLYHAEGGPIVAIQIENELYDQPEHLRTLKNMAIEAGIAPALWTATGWGSADLPEDEFIPVYAGYPEAPWDDAYSGWARHNRRHFFFTPLRDDHTVGADLRRDPTSGAGVDSARYPYATCELGGGIQPTYHRRPRVDPHDVAALALTKVGCGSSLQGYYMYHGGSHVTDAATTMQESLATGYPNDLPIVSYDFQAPLGEYGQVRPAYGLLRAQHHMLDVAGSALAPMAFAEPDQRPSGLDDRETLRWSVRTDGTSGFLFVNNHQPGGDTLARHNGVRFALTDVAGSELVVPNLPVDIPVGAYFAWPFRFVLPGDAGTLESASAQLVTVLGDVVVLSQTAGIDVELVVQASGTSVPEGRAEFEIDDLGDGRLRIAVAHPGPSAFVDLGSVKFLVLDEKAARSVAVGTLWGARRLVVGYGVHVVPDGDLLHVEYGTDGGSFLVCPPPASDVGAARGSAIVPARGEDGQEGPFARFHVGSGSDKPAPTVTELATATSPAPQRTGGSLGRAAAPLDEDYDKATVLRVEVDASAFDGVHRLLLRLDWTGDVGRAEIGGELVADQYWNGEPWEIDLVRYRGRIDEGDELVLRLLPFDPTAAVYVPEDMRPDEVTLNVEALDLVPVYRISVGAGAA